MTIYTTTGTQFSKAGIAVSYTDDTGAASTQNVTFANKTFSIDSGLNVSAGDAYFAGAAEVHGAAHLDSTLLVDGAATLGSSLAVTGASNLNSTLAVAGASNLNNTLAVSGAASLNNTLAVAGAASLNSSLAVTGASHLNNTLAVAGATSMASTLAVSGAASMASTLDVTGASHLRNILQVDGAASMASSLAVTGAANLANTLAVAGAASLASTLAVTGAANLNNTLAVTGAASLASTLAVTGASNLNNTLAVAGAASLNSSLAVVGATTLTGALDVKAASHLESTLLVDGAASLGAALTVTGAATLNNGMTVNGTSTHNGALIVSGASSIGGALAVTGAATLNSALDVKGASHLEAALVVDGAASLGNSLTVTGASHLNNTLAVSGAASMASTLAVTGAATLSSTLAVAGNAAVVGAMDVTGASHLRNSALIDGAATLGSSLAVAGAANLANTLAVTGAASMASTLDVTGASHLRNNVVVDGAASMGGSLAVTGAASMASTLAVTGAANLSNTLAVTGAASLNNTLAVTGAASLSSSLAVTGAANLSNTLAVSGAASLNSSLAVSGASSMASTLAVTGAATFQNNVTVNGNLTVLGSQTAIDTTSLQVKDNAILLADGNAADVLPSGIQLQYKPSGAADVKYAGLKRLPTTGEFVFFKDSAKTIDDPTAGVSGTPIIISPNAVITQNTWSKNNINYIAQSSSNLNSNYEPYGAFNAYIGNQFIYSWCSADAVYTGTQGAYSGSASTTVLDGIGAVAGEWVQLQMSSPMAMASYNLACGGFNNMPRIYYIVGSNDGSSWYPVQKGEMSSNPLSGNFQTFNSAIKLDQSGTQAIQGTQYANASTGVFSDPMSTGSGTFTTYSTTTTAYSYYRMIATAVWGNNPFELNEWYINFLSSTTATLPSTYTVEWKSIENNTLPVNQAVSSTLTNISEKYMHRIQGYNLPAGTYSYSATAQNSSNDYNNIKLYDEFGNQLADLTGNGIVYPWTSGGTYTGSFTISNPVTIYAKMPPGEYYVYDTRITMVFTRTDASSSASADVYAVVMADAFNCASDARLKKDVVELEGALDKIDAIRGVHYHWIDAAQPQSRQVGVIAQEIQAAYPELVMEGGNGFLSVDYPKLTAVLIQSIKELKAMVLSLANK